MSLNKTDASGNTWSVTNEGYVNRASRPISGSSFTSNALDSGNINVLLNDESFTRFVAFNAPTVNASGDEQTVNGALNTGAININIARKTTIGDGYVRIVTTYTNAGTTATTLTEQTTDNIFYDSNTRVGATSSGDSIVENTDDWALVNSTSTSAVFGRVVSGGAGSPTIFQLSTDQLTTRHRFELAAGESKTILTFTLLAADLTSARTLATDISNLSSDIYLEGLTESELATLQNFTKDVTVSATTTLRSFERDLTLTGTDNIDGTGNDKDNRIEGNQGNNKLSGGAGDDTLVGGAGADTLSGGLGNDTYFVDGSDSILENPDEGIDTIISAGTVNIAKNGGLENIILTGTGPRNATGNNLNNLITGNSGNNVLNGGAGDDTLIAGGGIDTLNGGSGNDSLYVINPTTTIIDESGADTIFSSVNFSIDTLTFIEDLVLTGSAISGTGNNVANRLTGNDNDNVLDGQGGSDTMAGGKGDDSYVVNSSGDRVIELFNEGTDNIRASINYTLGEHVEQLTLIGTARTGTGNALDNQLVGNSSNNLLNGREGDDTLNGGAGTDTLNGGEGNDTYIVDSMTDKIIDESGIDTVESSISFSIATINAIENIRLTGNRSINATGNKGDNVIIGNNGNNIMNGGAGIDTASFETAGAGVTVSLSISTAQATGSAGSDTLINIERLRGSNFSDRLSGNNNDNQIEGGDGNDTIFGGSGDDRYFGGKGDDRLVDAAGLKLLDGGSGNDTYVLSGLSTHTEIFDLDGIDTLDASTADGSSTIDLRSGSSSVINGSLVTLSVSDLSESSLDVLFMQDASGSFTDDVVRVKTLVPSVIQTLVDFQSNVRFGLASFIDKDEYVYRTEQAMTNDQTAFRQALDRIVVGSGGDAPESQIEALLQAAVRQAEVGFRADSLKIAVVLTDADFHKAGDLFNKPANDGDALIEDEDYPTLDLLKSKLIDSGIVPVFAVTSGNESTYQELVDFLGFGTVTILASDSSNLVSVLTEGIQNIAQARIENAIGTEFNDTIIGNELINVLKGGNGNDTYYVQNEEDLVVETSPSGGLDTIISEASFTLGLNVENLKLSGTDSINATGNSMNNVLHGNTGDNILDGKNGNDTMFGGRGNDTFVVGSNTDKVIEYAGQGTDTVVTTLRSYTLSQNIENLTFISTASSNGTGNAAANVLHGGTAVDTLSGLGGDDTLVGSGGADRLSGGEGKDSFRFTSLADDKGDTITDFVSATDRIEIDLVNFAPGAFRSSDFDFNSKQLTSSRFVSIADSATPTNLTAFNPTFVYRQDTGKLFFDADGRGSAVGEVEVVTLIGAPPLTATDIYSIS